MIYRDSEINFRRLRCLGRALGGEDCDEKGAALGVDEEMPRIPRVFEEKLKWAREFTEEDLRQVWADNYASAEDGKEDVWRQVDEEVAKGTMIKMSEEEALAKFGERLAVAALRAVPKELNSDKVRLIHDGSYSVDVDRRIRVRDWMWFPLIDDASAVLLEANKDTVERERGAPRAALVYYVKGAQEKDWGLQASRLRSSGSEDSPPVGGERPMSVRGRWVVGERGQALLEAHAVLAVHPGIGGDSAKLVQGERGYEGTMDRLRLGCRQI